MKLRGQSVAAVIVDKPFLKKLSKVSLAKIKLWFFRSILHWKNLKNCRIQKDLVLVL